MRIIFEPTTDQTGCSAAATQHRVVIEHPYDDLTIDDTLELIKSALVAYGYSESLVTERFEVL